MVIGLGAMGSAAAAHLARRGHRVVGFEQFTPAHDLGSSHGETRIVRQAYFEHPDYVPLAQRSYTLWDELIDADGRPLRHQHGGLMIGPSASSVVTGTLASAERWSLPHERLDRRAMASRYPQFRLADGDEAVFEAIAGWVSPEEGVAAHLRAAEAAGADLRFGVRVSGWDVTPAGVEVTVDGERWVAARLVLAAGAWAAGALEAAGHGLPLRPVRRVVGFFQPDDPAAFTPERFPIYVFQLADGDAIYGFPETTPGRGVKVGFHYRGPDVDPDTIERTVSDDEIAALRAAVAERIPGLSGPCLGTLGVHVHDDARRALRDRAAPGHRRPGDRRRRLLGHGYKFAPVIGEILADLATVGATDHAIGFLSPTRFSS